MTSCTTTSPACTKGCGPVTSTGNLGNKLCTCNTTAAPAVYNCQTCLYPQTLPSCYQPPLDAGVAVPPTCAAGIADKVACTTPCNGVCTITVDGGKLDGCVCVTNASGANVYTCQTKWWP